MLILDEVASKEGKFPEMSFRKGMDKLVHPYSPSILFSAKKQRVIKLSKTKPSEKHGGTLDVYY